MRLPHPPPEADADPTESVDTRTYVRTFRIIAVSLLTIWYRGNHIPLNTVNVFKKQG